MRRAATLFSLVSCCLAGPPVHAELPPPLARLLADAGIPEDGVGLVVAPVARGARFVEHGAERALQPGSTMKLVTTLVGLEQLGPGFVGRTRVLATAPVRDGVLQGDLVLQGGGDADFNAADLANLLRRLRDRGLKDLRGDLVLDRSWFNPMRYDIGVPPFDEQPEFAYNLIPDALMVGGNLLRIELFSDERGLQVVAQPPLAGARVIHEMVLVDGDCAKWDDGWKPPEVRPGKLGRMTDIVLRGTFPVGCERSFEIATLDRNDFVGRAFRAQWTALGGNWRGKVREGTTPPAATLLGEHASRPLSEAVRAINKPSDNAMTRLLYLQLGRALEGERSEPTPVRADRAVRAWFRRQGIDDAGLVMDNGSGLSRSERIKPVQLEAVIRAGLNSRWAPEWLASLPIVGIDGTMRRRGVGSPAAGNARMKTGTLRNVVALAGTMADAAGRPCIVVAILNHDAVRPGAARPVIDGILDWVARSRFGETGDAAAAAPSPTLIR